MTRRTRLSGEIREYIPREHFYVCILDLALTIMIMMMMMMARKLDLHMLCYDDEKVEGKNLVINKS